MGEKQQFILKPIGDQVAIIRDEIKDKTESGIVLQSGNTIVPGCGPGLFRPQLVNTSGQAFDAELLLLHILFKKGKACILRVVSTDGLILCFKHGLLNPGNGFIIGVTGVLEGRNTRVKLTVGPHPEDDRGENLDEKRQAKRDPRRFLQLHKLSCIGAVSGATCEMLVSIDRSVGYQSEKYFGLRSPPE